MEDIFYVIFGVAMIYSIIHFFIVQFEKKWSDRTSYEKFITVFALVSISLILIGTMNAE
jgi:hypothetical protein